jgi:hypothetical protein
MAEMIGFSRGLERRTGATGGLFRTFRLALSRFTCRRPTRLQFEEWPDYLLRDIGVDRASLEQADPRTTDLMRR